MWKKIPEIPDYPKVWAEHAAHFPQYREGDTTSYYMVCDRIEVGEQWVNYLLYIERNYGLAGILYYYPFDFPPYQQKGNIAIYVHPERQKKQIGRKLLLEAISMWPIDLEQQQCTPLGLKLVKRILYIQWLKKRMRKIRERYKN